jgi:hypothetical protein
MLLGSKMLNSPHPQSAPPKFEIPHNTGNGHKQIIPFFFIILSILWLDTLIGTKINYGENTMEAMNLSFAITASCEASLYHVKYKFLTSTACS